MAEGAMRCDGTELGPGPSLGHPPVPRAVLWVSAPASGCPARHTPDGRAVPGLC